MDKFNEFMKLNANLYDENSILIIICNAKSKTEIKKNYKGFSIDTEFLDDNELNQISDMASKLDIPFRIFYDEKDFMSTIINMDSKYYKRLIVYNSAQNGVGPGRKALIPSFCKYFSIRITGSDTYRVCLCRDKFAVNSILKANGIKVPYSILFNEKFAQSDIFGKAIAKPLYESASIGISKKNIFDFTNPPLNYLKNLRKDLNQPLLLQEFIDGYEFEIPVLSGEKSTYVFPPVVMHKNESSLIMGDDIMDYTSVYYDDYYFGTLPAQYNEGTVMETANEVVKLLNLKGLCRVDFRMKINGDFYVTDVATNPHFVEHSCVNHAFNKINMTGADILRTILLLS